PGTAQETEVTGPPFAISWNTTTAANGSHALAARARDAASNQTTSTAITVTVANSSGPPVIDATAWGDQGSARTTVATAAFSTSVKNELLLALVATDFASGANTTVTGVSGGGLTWQLVVRTNVQAGTSEIWRGFATS